MRTDEQRELPFDQQVWGAGYTSIGASTTEVQTNIISDKAIKLPRR